MGITGEISILPLIENVRQMNPTKLIRSIFAKRLSQIDRYADYGDIIQQKHCSTCFKKQNTNSE